MKSIFKKAAVAVAAVALMGSVAVTSYVRAAESTGHVMINSAAPQFTLQNENGKPVSLSDYAGKIVVLEWTNPDCPFVKAHYKAKTMINLAKQYQPQGVVWLAINSTHDANNASNKAWVAENSLEYPVLNDANGKVGHEYNAKSTPDMFVIDKTGNLVYSGAIDNDPRGEKTTDKVNYVSAALDAVLAGKPVAIAQTKSYGCSVHYAE